jgi:hypothetical protein
MTKPIVSRRRFVAGAAAATAAAVSKPALAFSGGSGTTPIYRIHPAIGVARLGNADPSTFFIGPEAPGYGPLGSAPGTAVPPYKAADGRVKPQGARFRIFEYAMVNGRLVPVREVNLDTPGVVSIAWTVHLANTKASFHQFNGPAGESTPPMPLRNATVTNRRSLEIDFGPRTIAGRSQNGVEFVPAANDPGPRDVNGNPVIGYLGQLLTDSEGRLIVLGGQGTSNYSTATAPSLASYANNDAWFDDTSDGPVTAVVTINDGGTPISVPVDANGGAWVLCPPPDFAPRIRGAVSGYDLLFDLAVREIPVPPESGLYDDGQPLALLRQMKNAYTPGADFEFPGIVPDFTTDVQPVLVTGYNYWWVDAAVTDKHNALIDPTLGNPDPQYDKNRQGIFVYLRPPLGVNGPTGKHSMPQILGDDPYIGSQPDAVQNLALTHVQYGLLRNWAYRGFTPPDGSPPPPAAITAWGLDEAALENCSGGAFFPGIEFSWEMRAPSLFAEPFRLNLAATSAYYGEAGVPIGPGYFSRMQALPWQADFNECRNEGNDAWWPTQRPNDCLPSATATQRVPWARANVKFAGGNQVSSNPDMLALWYKFGFVVEEGDVFVETERAAQIP